MVIVDPDPPFFMSNRSNLSTLFPEMSSTVHYGCKCIHCKNVTSLLNTFLFKSMIQMNVALDSGTGFTTKVVDPEMEVTNIILAKVSRFCLLSSHKHGFLSDLRFFNLQARLWISYRHLKGWGLRL